jgi:hypothetical protein
LQGILYRGRRKQHAMKLPEDRNPTSKRENRIEPGLAMDAP